MSQPVRRLLARFLLPLTLGTVDGLLNALTLTAGSLVGGGSPVTYGLAFRVGGAALVTAAFSVFVAEYAEGRAHLVRASRELNLTARGHLATTRLGRIAATRSLAATAVACAASFLGAAVPLLVGAALPDVSWIVVVLGVLALAAFGGLLGRLFAGRVAVWTVAMGIGGVAIAWIGVWLDIA